MKPVTIGAKTIGPDHPCLIVAEVAQNHDGTLGLAHAFIDAVATTGADVIKFQTHIADAESTPGEPFRVKFSHRDASRYDYWKRMEFSEAQWKELAAHAREKKLIFMSSPFSIEAVDLLERLGMPAWKIGSGEVGTVPLLERIAGTGKPVILSTGLSTLAEIDRAVDLLRNKKMPCVLLQCTTAYPCPPELVGLNMIPVLRERYGVPVGLSDHSGTIYPSLAAASLGACILEVHVTLTREMFGPDVSSSVTPAELCQLVQGVRFIEKMVNSPVDKDMFADKNEELRQIFFKSIVTKENLKAGTILKKEHLTVKKPGTGIPASRIKEVIGKRLCRDVTADEVLHETDLA